MVKKLLQQRKKTGCIKARHHPAGRKKLIVAEHRIAVRKHLKRKPDMPLAELREALGLECTLPAIHHVLVDMGLTKKTRRAAEQDREDVRKARWRWKRKQGGLEPWSCSSLMNSFSSTPLGTAPRSSTVMPNTPISFMSLMPLLFMSLQARSPTRSYSLAQNAQNQCQHHHGSTQPPATRGF